jgi:putative transposase
MIMGFIDMQRAKDRPVELICGVLRSQGCQVTERSYRRWRARVTAPRPGQWVLSARTVELAYLMNTIHCAAFDEQGRLRAEGLYGRRKMTALLARQHRGPGSAPSYDRVDAAMRALRLNGIRRGKKVRTTVPAKDGRRAGDLLDRDCTANAPNSKWVMDFTYVRACAGFVYVAFILDCCSQRIVAWHASTCKQTEMVMTPLRMALWQRDRDGHHIGPQQLICHSDAGSQYTSVVFTDHPRLQEISASIGSVGDAYDNALMEGTIGLYKTECIASPVFHDGPLKTITDVEFATSGWVSWFNTTRLHSSIGMVPPVEYEQTHYKSKVTQDATA